MALSPKDKYWIHGFDCQAEIDIDRGLDFPIKTSFLLRWKSSKLKYENVHNFPLFSSQSFMKVPKSQKKQ